MILQIKRGNRVIAESADFSYSPSLQEVRKLTCEVVSVVPIEFKAYNSKSESEYDTVVYNGNTFILYQAPSGDNLNEAGKYKYSLLFYGKEVLLQNVAFLDIVSGTGGEINKIRYTHGGLFQFWGDAKQLAARIEANIQSYNASLGAGYTGIGTWTLNVDAEGDLTEDMIDITDGTNLFEALKNFYDKFYLNYYFSTTANGGIITITDKTRPSVNWTFKQGDGGGAVKVSSSVDTSTPVITRIIPQGGSRNVPPEYKKDAKPADESRYCPYILLPNDSAGNIRYYIDSEYGLKNYGVRGKTISNTFSGIYPSIRGKKLGDLYPSGLPEWDTYKADGEPDPQSGKVAGEGASASTRIDKIIGSTPIKSDDSDSFFIYMTSPGFNLGYKVYEDGDSSDKINDNVQPQYKPHAMFDKYRDFERFDIYGTRAYYDQPVKVTATFSGKMLFSILPIGSDAVGKKVKINLRMVLNRVLGQASPLKEVVIGEEGATGMLEIPYDKTALVGYIEKGQNTTVTIRVEFTFDSDIPAESCKIGFSEEMTCNIHFGNQDGSQDRFYYKYASVTDAVFSMRTGTYTGTEFKINKNGIIPLYGEVNGDTGETEEDVAMFNKGARYKISCYRTDSDNAKLPLYTDGKSPSIAAGTEFVILNIVMPESYVTMAENTLEKAALDYLSRYDHENRTVSLDISSGFVAEHPNLFIDFIEGNMLKVRDDGIGVFDFSDNGQIVDMQLQIQSLEIKYSKENMFPSYSCTIARRKILSFYERLAQENQTASTQNTTNVTLGGSGTGSGTGSGGGSSNITNADHAKSAYTLDDDTPVLNWFLSALNDDEAEGIINFLKGLKISGNLINRIVKQGDMDVTYTDEDVMSALRVMVEIEKLKEIFLRKDVADSTKYLLSLLGGVLIKKYAKFGDFVTGVSGGYIDEKGDMEMGSGVFRKRLFVPEIAYNRTTYFKGRMVNSPGGGCSVLSYVDNGDGTYTITPDLTDADGLSQFVDDILTTYFVTKNSEGKLNGFEEMKFRVTAADYTAKKFTVMPRPGHSDWKPAEQMVLAQTGNFTDPERQTYILIDSVNGNNCITFFDNANTWDPEPAQMPAWFGKKKGMTVAGINADNYSAVLQNIIMTGLIFQVDEITGQTVRVPLDKGEWTAGKYAYYNRVSHNGALWLCVDDNGTTTEPSDDNPAWLKQVDKGDKGDPGLSVVGGGHWESANTPYSANTMVTLANCVFISKVETSNPPIRILRIKGGNFLRKKDGGYYLAGKPADWEVNEDWDMLLDGRELKGESITFLGEFATAPANPKNGDSYRNTTDRATYIYQDGRWQLMISDGKDGKGYEYIYTRGNIIDNTPEKPDSQQKDGYVPEGWTDNYLGTDIDHQVEWGCTRFKENGVWSEFSDPAVVHRWSKDGADGESITAAGHWESANIPYAKNSTVSFAGGSYLSKVQTSNPPLPLLRVRGGSYLRKKDGGYILSGKRSDKAVNSDWQEMTSGVEPSASYWLDSPVSTINFTSTGTPSPSAFVVTMKQNIGGNVSDTNRFYLVARKYNGSWLAHVGATLNSQISVPATAGYTQFAVRAYKSASDANAWNNNFVAEKGVGVAKDGAIGATGATGAFPRDRGVWASGQTYVWNADYRDKVIYLIGGVYYNFLVKNYGASVTSAPTSANGDSNWEAMQKFVNIATDTLFADGANVAGFMFKDKVLKSFNDKGETLLINGVTGYFKCKNAEITGTITADKGRIGPFSIASGILSSKILYENETNKYVGFNLSAGQIEFYNERTFANVRIGGNTQFVTIEGIKYDAGIDIQSPNAMIGMHIKTPSIPLFVEGGNIFLHPNNDSYVSLRGIVGNWRNISVKASLNNNDDNVMFINRDNIEVTLPPDVPGHTIYFKRMSGGVRLTGGRILPAPGGREVSYIDLDFASGFIKCMGNYWVMFYCG